MGMHLSEDCYSRLDNTAQSYGHLLFKRHKAALCYLVHCGHLPTNVLPSFLFKCNYPLSKSKLCAASSMHLISGLTRDASTCVCAIHGINLETVHTPYGISRLHGFTTQSQDWHAFLTFRNCVMQSRDYTYFQIAWNKLSFNVTHDTC